MCEACFVFVLYKNDKWASAQCEFTCEYVSVLSNVKNKARKIKSVYSIT